MIRAGRWPFSSEGILTIAILGLALYAVWPAPAVQEARDDALETERILRGNRNVLVTRQAKADTVTRAVTRGDGRISAQSDSLTRALLFADSVRNDISATNADLRQALGVALRRTETFQASVLVYRDSVRELIAAHALERLAVNRTLIAADSAVQAWKDVAEAERRESRKKFWRGVLIGGAVGVALTGGVTLLLVAL